MAYVVQTSLLVVLLMVLGSHGQDDTLRLAVEEERRIPYPCRYTYVWGGWGRWGKCNATCGEEGIQTRSRQCYRICNRYQFESADAADEVSRVGVRLPTIGQQTRIPVSSRYCRGSPIQTQKCSGGVNGGWSEWGCWGECKNGRRQRHRVCNRPIPEGWGNYCQGKPTETGDCECIAGQDVIFVIDESGSIGRTNFNLMVNQVNSVIQLLDLDYAGSGDLSKVRVGIELFDSNPTAHNQLKDFTLPSTPYPYNGGGTNIAAAIRYAHKNMFTSTNGDRTPHNPNTMVVITDGQSADPRAAAQAAKADGIKIIAVGVGNNVNLNHLRGIVSDVRTDLHRTNNFCAIADYLKKRFDCNKNQFKAALTPTQCTRTVFRTSADAGRDGGEVEARRSIALPV